jgi:NAD(P)-dependent dehydrogenase (short-subunit alcohol dehydrogenase family)
VVTTQGQQGPDRDAADGRLGGRVAVVTGAASGLGRAITARYVAEGATVVAGDIDGPGLDALAADRGPAVVPVVADVTAEADVEALFGEAVERFGRVDVAVANAGAGHAALLVDHTLEDWQRIIDLCLTGVFLTVKHAGRAMVPAGHGSIVVIASLNATQPGRGMAAYCSAKAAVTMLTQVAALELGPEGIRTNAIAPGLVITAATEPLQAIPGVIDEYLDNAPLGRSAEPDEIAEAATYLASDGSGYVNGAVLAVDGGAHTRRYPDVIGAIDRMLGGYS